LAVREFQGAFSKEKVWDWIERANFPQLITADQPL